MDANVDGARLPMVDPFYFASGEQELFGVHYLPAGRDVDHAVLICPAYGQEYNRAHCNLQQLAVQLAQAGCHVLRFDYTATGNSTGASEQANVNKWRSDVMAAAEFLRNKSQQKRLSIVGVRLGATLACGCTVPNVQSLILWDPISRNAVLCQLLDESHGKTLLGNTGLPRANAPTDVDQAHGYRTLVECAEFKSDVLQNATQSAKHRYLVASREYISPQSIKDVPDQWQVRQTGDAACWRVRECAASPCSSAETAATIASIVTDGELI